MSRGTEARQRTEQVNVRLTPEELAALQVVAQRAASSPQSMLRDGLRIVAVERQRILAEFEDLAKQWDNRPDHDHRVGESIRGLIERLDPERTTAALRGNDADS